MHFLGIDIGSSFIKGAVLCAEKLTIEHVTRLPFPEPLADNRPGCFEIDPRAVVAAVKQVIDDLLARTADCRGILFSSQMGGVILADDRGQATSNYFSWRDQRTMQPHPKGGGTYLEAARERIGPAMQGEMGNEFRAGSAHAILFWLQEEGWLKKDEVPLSLGDFVVMSLCQSRPCSERTQALGTLDLRRGDWHQEALAKLGLAKLAWPPLVPVWRPAGMYRHAQRSIPCYSPVGDYQAALTGALLQSGELSLNVSTGCQVSLLTEEYVPGDYQTRPHIDGRFLNTITHLPAGRSLDVLVNLLTELPELTGTKLDNAWPAIVNAVERAPDSDLAVNLAFFDGPLGNRGSITGITTENLTVGQIFRAAFRNMAQNFETCAGRLSPQRDWQRIVFSGGLVQKLDLLRKFILEKLPGESRICSSTEDALLGLLVISLVISGRAKDLREASQIVGLARQVDE